MESGWRRRARRAGHLASGAALAATAGIAALALAPAALGLQRYVIVSGSMTGTYDRGTLVLDDVVPVGALRVGDVITYRPPSASAIRHLVTHRLVRIVHDRMGGTALIALSTLIALWRRLGEEAVRRAEAAA